MRANMIYYVIFLSLLLIGCSADYELTEYGCRYKPTGQFVAMENCK